VAGFFFESRLMTCDPIPPRPSQSIGGVVGQCLLAAISFSLVTETLRPQLPPDGLLAAKQRYFARHRDDYDCVFFGSSRIYRGFDPLAFREHLAKRPPLRAFNFGSGALRPHELNHWLRKVLASPPRRLRYVIIELMDWTPSLPVGLESHARTVDWHTLPATWQACRTEWLSDQAWWTRILNCQQHLALAACRFSNHGNGPRRWHEWTRNSTAETRDDSWLGQRDGFLSLDSETGDLFRIRRQRFLQRYYTIFLEQISVIDQTNRTAGDLSHFNMEAQRDQQAWLLRRGLKPIYVIPNLRWGTPTLNCLKSQGMLRDVVTLNHTRRFSDLYRPDHYFDRGHLNNAGAIAFSRILADQISPHLVPAPPPID